MTTLPTQSQSAASGARAEAAALLAEQAEALQTAVHATIRGNLFDNYGRLMTPRLIPEASRNIVQSYLQGLRTADPTPIADLMEQLVALGLGKLSVLAVTDILYETSLALLPAGLAANASPALKEARHTFLHHYMLIRERITVAARETLYQNVESALEKQVAQERELRRELQERSSQLARERALLTSLLDSIPDLIFYKDVDGMYLGCNSAFSEFAGQPIADIVGRTDFDMFPHEVAAAFREQDVQMMALGESRHNEEWVNYPDGRRVLLDTLKTPFYDADKNLIGLIGISRDVTAAYESQAEVRRLSYVVEQSLDGTAVANLDGTIEFVNPVWASMHGYTPEELIGQPLSIFHTPEQLANETEPLNQQVMETGQAARAEVGHVHKDGFTFPTLMTVGLLRDRNGDPIGLVASAQDISEQKAAAAALRENQTRLAEAVEIARLHYWEFDVASQIFTFLPAYFDLLGAPAKDGNYTISAGEYASKFVPDHEAAIVGKEIAAALTSSDPHYSREFDSLNLTADGRVFPIRVRYRVIRNSEGQAVKFIGANQDITDQVEAEKALRENEARLAEATHIAKLYSWEFDVATELFTFTPEYYDLLGTTVEEEGGLTMLAADYARRFVPPEEAAIVGKEVVAALATTDPNYRREFDSLNLTKDGRIIPIRVRFRVVKDEEGRTIKTVGANQDITEQVKAEQALRAAQERAETILRSVTVPMLISEVQSGKIVYANEYLAQTVRVPLDELVGNKTPNFYVRSEDRTAVIHKIQTQGNVSNYQLQLRRSDGELFWSLLSAQLFEFQGETAILTTFLDITDRIRAEEQVAHQAHDLQTVADVSAAVRANLQNQQELLQQVADLTKERFELYHAHIYLLEPESHTLVLAAGAGDVGRAMTAEGRRIPLGQQQSLVARAARTRQGISINNVQADPGFLPHPLLPETRAEMAVPMLAGDEVIGVLDVQADRVDAFTAEDVSIKTTLATQIGVAVQNARSYAASEAARQELSQITRRLTREGWQDYLTQLQLKPELSVAIGQAPANGQALNQSLLVQGEKIGQLVIAEPQAFTSDFQDIVTAVAERLSGHIENLRLSAQTEAALLLTENLYEAGRRLNTSGENLQEAVGAVAEAATIPAVTRLLLLLSEYDAGGNLTAVRHAANWYSGKGNPPPPIGIRYTREMLQDMDIFAAREAMAVNDTATDERLSPSMHIMFQQIRTPSVAILPLWVGDRQLGSLFLETTEPYIFREADLEPYRALSGQLAIAIDRQRLLTEAEQRAERERQIRTITDKIRRGVDRESILRLAREEIGQMLGAKTAVAQLGTSAALLERLHQQEMAENADLTHKADS